MSEKSCHSNKIAVKGEGGGVKHISYYSITIWDIWFVNVLTIL